MDAQRLMGVLKFMLIYVNLVKSLYFFSSLERNKVGYTLLYSSPLFSYNPSYTSGSKRPLHNL
jgi:hypothetical protein